ncbi:ribonuclease T2 [Azospirillum sp. SYSU D00513]|uniref:ribonuclease T2 family protein n=1 Tax=Azospirillum sp. SYSU D00513 TaxID=2812561 RepID=UPI001A95C118|nr:ribonuclease T2 [Azospirillum sp. SYSU D00513]
MRAIFGPAAALAVCLAAAAAAFPARAQEAAEPGAFDYYLLSLSWSPAHCAEAGERADPTQCGVGRRFGFIVHGLWPQHVGGGYPANCATDRTVPDSVVESTLPVMPSARLIRHQWRKHGSCSGLPVADYFAKTRAAHGALKVPEPLNGSNVGRDLPAREVERLFVEANPGLTPDRIALVCRKKALTEVRLCLGKDLAFTDCGRKVEDRCGRDAMLKASR